MALSADVIAATVLSIVVQERDVKKLATLCLRQLHTTLASEMQAVPETEHTAKHHSMKEQMRVVKAVLANLTLNELREQWQTWDSEHASSIWSAFGTAESSSFANEDDAAANDEDDIVEYHNSTRPAKKAKIV
jgi:hypothetical protein